MTRPLTAIFVLSICFVSAAAQVRVPQRVRVSEEVMQGLLIKKVSPQWPADAVHIRGVVALKARIDKAGSVENLEVISGHPMLIPAAIDAVKQWKYKPYMLNGVVWPVETTVHVSFLTQGEEPTK